MVIEEKITRIKDIIEDDLVVVSFTPPPTYLLPFVTEKDILFVYKQKEQIVNNSLNFAPVRSKFDSDSDDLDFTGQPLECPFSSDEDEPTLANVTKYKEENKQNPLDLSDTRKIISIINLKVDLSVPIFFLTNGEKNEPIVLGSSRNTGWQTRSWITLHDSAVDGNKVISVDEMMSEHRKLSLVNPKHTTSEVRCQYLLESAGDTHATFLHDSHGSVEFNLCWETPSFTVPLDRTAVEITVKTLIGNEDSDISTFWFHLMLLHDYLEIIKKWKSERGSQGLYSRHNINFPSINQLSVTMQCDEPNSKSVPDRLTQLLQTPNEITGTTLLSRIIENEKKTLEDTVRKLTTEKREEEFTDRLWILLIECTSYEELCTCVDKVFQAVRNGVCKPYIKSTNISRFAQALRRCKQDPARFTLTLEPLELLIEIGIEKLKKDFIGIFLLAKVATSEQLRIPQLPKFAEMVAADWLDNCSEWITWLLRIHVCLQLMLFTESLVQMKGCIASLTLLALDRYLGSQSPIQNQADPRHITSQTFTTAVNTVDVQDLLNRKTPFNSWTLRLYSETSSRRVTSIFHRDMNEKFPSSVCVVDEMDASVNNTFMLNACPYHCYNFHSVADLFE